MDFFLKINYFGSLQMNSLKGLLTFPRYLRLSPSSVLTSTVLPSPLSQLPCLQRTLTTSPIMSVENKKAEIARQKTSKMVANLGLAEDRDLNIISLDSLASAETVPEGEASLELGTYPDEDTANQMFNGILFKDLPYVTLVLHRNNTKLIARYADERYIWHNAPSYHGFKHAKKRTNVAGQVAGLNMGQTLRGVGIRTIRVRVNGFNAARVSALKGLVQAGIEIVAIADCTTVNWDWPQRARKRPRKN